MATVQPANNHYHAAANKQSDQHIITKIYNVLFVTIEVIILLVKVTLSTVKAIYETFVPPPERSVVGEIVLVTGTGHGIGKELAKQYGALGATVVCVDINKPNNDATVDELKKIGVKAHGYVCDVSSRDDVLALADKIQKEVGDVTILVNNAGIMPCKRFEDYKPEVIRKIFDVNVMAHFWTLEAFLPKMTENNYGHIVALSSMAGVCGFPNLVPYCGSKFAVRGMMEALEEEYRQSGRNVNFTAIYPSIVDTGLCQKPRIKYPSLLNPLPPPLVAEAIISAQRRNYRELSIPSFMLKLNNIIRLYPVEAAMHVIDFFDSGVDPHDD